MSHPLKQDCLDNLIRYWSLIAETANGIIIRHDKMTAALMGINSGIFNAIFNFNPLHYQQIKSAIKHQYDKSIPISFWLDDDATIEGKNFFAALNLASFGHVPLMAIETNVNFAAPLQPDIKIIPYDSNSFEWMGPFNVCFGIENDIRNPLQDVFEKIHSKMQHFVALHQDQIVACASVFTETKMAGFYNLATLPEYRNKGIATALHHARLRFAKENGFRYATLQATPMATHLDTTLGFQRVGGFTIYMDKI